jgi:hypothetical protein
MFACSWGNGSAGYPYSFSRVYRSYRGFTVDKAWLLGTGVIFFTCIIPIPRFPDARPFTSTDDLRQQILDFIAYFNRTFAKPFQWKFEGYTPQKKWEVIPVRRH